MLLLLLQAAVAQPPVNLTCVGGGTANKAAVATVNSYGNASGMVGTTPFSASVQSCHSISRATHRGSAVLRADAHLALRLAGLRTRPPLEQTHSTNR